MVIAEQDMSLKTPEPVPPDYDKMVVQLSVNELRRIVGEEIAAALQNGGGHAPEKDGLLSPEEAAAILGQNVRWLYRHADKLPFTRRISRKNLRFSEGGLRRWLAARKPDSRR
jgi:predicted DNA-binding transcriptional regulator AlpA